MNSYRLIGPRNAFRVRDKWSSRVASIEASPREVIAALGMPIEELSDDYKVLLEWRWLDEDEELYTLYDYKMTSLYASHLLQPKDFVQSDATIAWLIGASYTVEDDELEEFYSWLKHKIFGV